MFQNPDTLWIEIIIVVLTISFLLFIIGRHFYRKKKGLPTGECACCQNKGKTLVKNYHKKYCKS